MGSGQTSKAFILGGCLVYNNYVTTRNGFTIRVMITIIVSKSTSLVPRGWYFCYERMSNNERLRTSADVSGYRRQRKKL